MERVNYHLETKLSSSPKLAGNVLTVIPCFCPSERISESRTTQDHDVDSYKVIRKAIKAGRLSEVVTMIENDASLFNLDTPFGTSLHMASAHGQLEIAKWLVSKGVDVNSIGGAGEDRPLDEAAAAGHVDVAKFLIASGAVLDVSNSVRNPLLSAIVGGLSESHTAVAKLLIDAGIDTTVRYANLNNMNALEHAKEWGRRDIVKLLEGN